MSQAHLLEIEEMAKRFGRTLSAQAEDDYMEVALLFSIDLFKAVIKKMRKSARSLPTPAEIEQEAISMRQYFDEKISAAPSDLICRYYSQGESELSKALCTKLEENQVIPSKNYLGVSICVWHQQCIEAKANPGGSSEYRVRHRLREAKAKQDMGEEAYFLSRLGFNPMDNAVDPAEKVAGILRAIGNQASNNRTNSKESKSSSIYRVMAGNEKVA